MQVHNKWPKRLLLVCAPALLVSCQTQSSGPNSSRPDESVAGVGDQQITTEEFRIAYELASPSRLPDTDDRLERKRYFLDRMIERKILALAGMAEGLDTTSSARRVIEWERRQALIRALYRTNIEADIEVTEDDLRDAFINSTQVVALRQIRLSSRTEADAIYKRILAGESFVSIAIERAPPGMPPARVLEPREFNWGDLDKRIETAASGLSRLEVSAPIETRSGFHVLQLVNRRQNVMLTEAAFDSRRSYLDMMIRRQRG
ncbi:MAG: peptidylprolyl isomerase, partial [Rhodothermia bacterium]